MVGYDEGGRDNARGPSPIRLAASRRPTFCSKYKSGFERNRTSRWVPDWRSHRLCRAIPLDVRRPECVAIGSSKLTDGAPSASRSARCLIGRCSYCAHAAFVDTKTMFSSSYWTVSGPRAQGHGLELIGARAVVIVDRVVPADGFSRTLVPFDGSFSFGNGYVVLAAPLAWVNTGALVVARSGFQRARCGWL